MTTITIPVKGMTCSGCVQAVTKALERIDGVTAVTVDLANQSATVTFDEAKADVAVLKQTVMDAGYDTE